MKPERLSKNVHNVRKSIYEKDRALAEKRKQEAKEREIQELQETIEISRKRLVELLNDASRHSFFFKICI